VKLLFFSDIHGDARQLERLMATEADYYFCAGDLVNFGRNLDTMYAILRPRGEKVFVIPGNHESAAQTADACARHGVRDFHGGHVELGGFHITGLGHSNQTPFDTPGEYSEEELATRLEAFNGLSPMIAVCHVPPYGTMLDRITNLKHAGSKAVREFLQREEPRYFFCGHIHEAAGAQEKLGNTSAMNVGKKGYLLDLAQQKDLGFI
jgi:Icc-related predicted phosphoesterase